jgi:hypothetical protein
VWISVGLVAALGGVIAAVVYFLGPRTPADEGLEDALADRRSILLLGDDDLRALSPRRAEVVRAEEAGPDLTDALLGSVPEAFVHALREGGFDAVLVDGRGPVEGDSMVEALSRYAHVRGLAATYLTPLAAVYRLDEVEALEPAHAEAMGHVARRIISGDRPPRVASFPEPLRRVRNVEVMVLLRERGQARLWRSARGSSLARALVTAAVVARQRWQEREQAMGGPLDELLPRLTVEVVRLSEDGTLGARSEAFLERVFTPEHGVAYERRGTWHYQLPSTRSAAPGAVFAAYLALFEDNGLEPEALDRTDLRPYRLVATPLAESLAGPGASAPSPDGSDALSASRAVEAVEEVEEVDAAEALEASAEP